MRQYKVCLQTWMLLLQILSAGFFQDGLSLAGSSAQSQYEMAIKKGFNYFDNFDNQNHQIMSIKIIKIMMIGKRMRLWEERGVIHVLCSNVISLGTVPVSKQHLFTLSLFVFILKISHFRDKKKKKIPQVIQWQEGKARGVRVLCMLLAGSELMLLRICPEKNPS